MIASSLAKNDIAKFRSRMLCWTSDSYTRNVSIYRRSRRLSLYDWRWTWRLWGRNGDERAQTVSTMMHDLDG